MSRVGIHVCDVESFVHHIDFNDCVALAFSASSRLAPFADRRSMIFGLTPRS